MSVTTYAYAIAAVEEALSAGHGSSRTLDSADYFSIDYWDDRPEQMAALLAHEQKLADVYVGGQEPTEQGEHINIAGYHLTFVITMAYYLGHEAVRSELRATYTKAATDYHKIRSVLCWPGNLTEDASGNATGLVSGCLATRTEAGRSTWRTVVRTTEEARLLLSEATFPAQIYLTFPT